VKEKVEMVETPQETKEIEQNQEDRKEKIRKAINDLKISIGNVDSKLIRNQDDFSEKKISEKNFKEKKLTLLEIKSQIRKEITELKLSLMDI